MKNWEMSIAAVRRRVRSLLLGVQTSPCALARAVARASKRGNAVEMGDDADDRSGGVSAVSALSLSVVSSVSLVIVNKRLISEYGFREGA